MLTFKSPVGREAEGKNSQMYFLSQFSVRCIFSCFARLIKNEYLKYQTCRDGGHMSRTHTTPPPPSRGVACRSSLRRGARVSFACHTSRWQRSASLLYGPLITRPEGPVAPSSLSAE